jgi:uncharacterized membrane protein YgdD (TMEM256/DUF423 family)
VKFQRPLLAAAALLGFASVAIGAAIDHIAGGGNHALETAARYNQIYAVLIAVIACALPCLTGRTRRFLHISGWLFVAGTICFCGGIYVAELAGLHAFVYAAPIGGTTLMTAWIVMFLAALV